jgi:hypothetical protein
MGGELKHGMQRTMALSIRQSRTVAFLLPFPKYYSCVIVIDLALACSPTATVLNIRQHLIIFAFRFARVEERFLGRASQ